MEEVSDIYENRKISPEKKISKDFVQLAGIYRLIFAVRQAEMIPIIVSVAPRIELKAKVENKIQTYEINPTTIKRADIQRLFDS